MQGDDVHLDFCGSASISVVTEIPGSPPFFLHQPHSLHVCDGCPAREGGFDLNLQPPLDTPLPKYNTQLWGCATSVIMEREEQHLDSGAGGQRVTRFAISSWMSADSQHQRGDSSASHPFLATAGHSPPPFKNQGSQFPSLLSGASTPILFLLLVFLIICLEPGTPSPQNDERLHLT